MELQYIYLCSLQLESFYSLLSKLPDTQVYDFSLMSITVGLVLIVSLTPPKRQNILKVHLYLTKELPALERLQIIMPVMVTFKSMLIRESLTAYFTLERKAQQ